MFSCKFLGEYNDERILKIGQHLSELWTNVSCHSFFWFTVYNLIHVLNLRSHLTRRSSWRQEKGYSNEPGLKWLWTSEWMCSEYTLCRRRWRRTFDCLSRSSSSHWSSTQSPVKLGYSSRCLTWSLSWFSCVSTTAFSTPTRSALCLCSDV